MGAKERIAAIRLLEYLEKHPAYAAALGVEGSMKKSESSAHKCE